jgi:hypothetical protein
VIGRGGDSDRYNAWSICCTVPSRHRLRRLFRRGQVPNFEERNSCTRKPRCLDEEFLMGVSDVPVIVLLTTLHSSRVPKSPKS